VVVRARQDKKSKLKILNQRTPVGSRQGRASKSGRLGGDRGGGGGGRERRNRVQETIYKGSNVQAGVRIQVAAKKWNALKQGDWNIVAGGRELPRTGGGEITLPVRERLVTGSRKETQKNIIN